MYDIYQQSALGVKKCKVNILSVWLLVSRYSKGRAGVPSRLCMQIQQTSVPKISGVPIINDF